MLEYFPCTASKSIKETKTSKTSDEKRGTTETHKTSRPQGRGRGNTNNSSPGELPQKPGGSTKKPPGGSTKQPNNEKSTAEAKKASGLKRKEKRPSEKTDKPTLLNIAQDVGNIKGVPKNEVVEDDGMGKIDTSQGDSVKTEKVTEPAVESAAEETVKNTADRKSKEHFRKLNWTSLV